MSHEKFQSCITACYECATACDHCIIACLNEEDVKMMHRCIEMDMYCAEICRTAAMFMTRADEHTMHFAMQICKLCADICEACANECKQHDDEHCQRCAEACFRCAEECRKMAA